MYKILTLADKPSNLIGSVVVLENKTSICVVPFDPANTDYQQFVWQINHDEAELEDADGNLMTPEEAKAFVATLPAVPNYYNPMGQRHAI